MSRKINQFAIPSDALVANSNQLMTLGDPGDGKLYKPTVGQVKKALSTFKRKYVASGSEGTVLTISELAGMEILVIYKEGVVLMETASAPDSLEFTFDGTSIGLGLGVQVAGERFLILYKKPY